MHAAATVERVLEEGVMRSTYKLAVLRALVDITIEQPGQGPINGFHLVPLIDLARRAMAYYWRPALEHVSQGHQPTAISKRILELADRSEALLGCHRVVTTGAVLHDRILEASELPADLLGALLAIRRTLLEQPLQYIRNLPNGRAELFSLVVRTAPGDPPLPIEAGYEVHRVAALQTHRLSAAKTWPDLIALEHAHLVLSARTYEELSELRFWLRDAILYRWIRATERFETAQPVPPNLLVLERPGRDLAIRNQLRSLYETVGDLSSVYSGMPLLVANWDLDHLLPISRYPVELFWNLVPATRKENAAKSDRLPPLSADFRDRYCGFVTKVIQTGNPTVQADVEATYRRYYQRAVTFPDLDRSDVVRAVWSVVEQSWARLDSAGAPLWKQ